MTACTPHADTNCSSAIEIYRRSHHHYTMQTQACNTVANTARWWNERLKRHKPSLCFFVLKTQIKIRPQPLVYDLSMVCVWFGSSVLRLSAIYTQDLRLHRLFCSPSGSNPPTTLRKHFCPPKKKQLRGCDIGQTGSERNAQVHVQEVKGNKRR